MADLTKWCAGCQQSKPAGSFYKREGRASGECKACKRRGFLRGPLVQRTCAYEPCRKRFTTRDDTCRFCCQRHREDHQERARNSVEAFTREEKQRWTRNLSKRSAGTLHPYAAWRNAMVTT